MIHDDPKPTNTGAKAISFSKGSKVRPEVASALRRLHQNLGHPDAHDLARHLRLAGADQSVIDAAKGLRCMTCERNQRGGTAKPSAMPTILEFNQVVGVDAFSVVDSSGVRYEMLSAVDHGTGFHLVVELKGHTAQIRLSANCGPTPSGHQEPWLLTSRQDSRQGWRNMPSGLARRSDPRLDRIGNLALQNVTADFGKRSSRR